MDGFETTFRSIEAHQVQIGLAASAIGILFFIRYFFKGGVHDWKAKILGFISLLIGLGIFFCFFTAGINLGKKFNLGIVAGALIGVAAFGICLRFYAWLRTPKELRSKSKIF